MVSVTVTFSFPLHNNQFFPSLQDLRSTYEALWSARRETHFLEAASLISMYIIEMSLIAARSLRLLFCSFENRHVNHLIVPKNHMDFRLLYVSRDHCHGTQVIKQGCRKGNKGVNQYGDKSSHEWTIDKMVYIVPQPITLQRNYYIPFSMSTYKKIRHLKSTCVCSKWIRNRCDWRTPEYLHFVSREYT